MMKMPMTVTLVQDMTIRMKIGENFSPYMLYTESCIPYRAALKVASDQSSQFPDGNFYQKSIINEKRIAIT